MSSQVDVRMTGSEAFRTLHLQFPPGASLWVEPGAMAAQSTELDVQTHVNGGIFSGLLMRFLGHESFFINFYVNTSANSQHLMLSQSTPGDIVVHELRGESLYIQPGAFIARESGVRVRVVWAGLASFFAGEGLFRLCFTGQGRLWYGVYGAVIEKEVVGELLVDSGHLLSYPPEIRLKLGLAGGIFSSFFSGEGLVLRLQGHGKIRLQTRSLKGFAQWLNPRFWG